MLEEPKIVPWITKNFRNSSEVKFTKSLNNELILHETQTESHINFEICQVLVHLHKNIYCFFNIGKL